MSPRRANACLLANKGIQYTLHACAPVLSGTVCAAAWMWPAGVDGFARRLHVYNLLLACLCCFELCCCVCSHTNGDWWLHSNCNQAMGPSPAHCPGFPCDLTSARACVGFLRGNIGFLNAIFPIFQGSQGKSPSGHWSSLPAWQFTGLAGPG